MLSSLEQKFNVSFSFQDENVSDIVVFAPDATKGLQESLQFLSNQSGLEFRQINDQFIAVVKSQNPRRVVCGFVVDQDTGERLMGATVTFTNTSAITDALGYFELTPPDDDQILAINHLGYQPLYLSSSDFAVGCKTISLPASASELEEVVITNYIAEGIDKKVDGSLVISTRELQVLPGTSDPDILFTIQALPGITSVDETVSNINIRGGSNDQNLILWEGIRLYQSGHFFGLISAFNPYFGDDITIIRNGTSAGYGNGVSGTIMIRSEDRSLQEISGSIGAGFNMINGDINLDIPFSDRTVLKISSRRAITDLIRTPTFDRYFDRAFENTEVLDTSLQDTIINTDDNFYFYDVSSKFSHKFSDKDQVSLSFLRIFNKLDFEESEVSSSSTNSKTSELSQKSLAIGVNHARTWSSALSSFISGSVSKYELNGINYDIPNDQRLIQDNEVLDVNLKAEIAIKRSNSKFVAGYEFSEIGISDLEDLSNPDFRRFRKRALHTHAAFVEGQKHLADFQMRVGVRATYYHSLDRTVVEPRVVLNHSLSDEWSLELQGELKSQSTAQVIDLQTDFLGVEKRRWVLSNGDDIPLIQSKNISVGANYQKDGLLISLEGYARNVDGIITSSQGFQNQFELIRSPGSYRVLGGELLVDKKFDRSTAWLSYSQSVNDYTFDLLIPEQFPNNLDIRNNLSAGVSYQLGPFGLATGISYRSGKPNTALQAVPIIDGGLNYADPNGSRIKDYMRVDFSADYQFDLGQKTQGQLRISFWNLTGRKNSINWFYRLRDSQAESIKERALEFTPNIMFRVHF